MTEPSNKELFARACELAASGQPVFPCRREGGPTRAGYREAKTPLTRRGFLDASTDVETIRTWWRANPRSAIGIPTGIKWDVLDVDTKAEVDGRQHLPRLLHLGLLNGCKRLVRTPSGGYHLYFKSSDATTVKNTTGADLGLDVRGSGGYVLADPSWITTDSYAGSYEEITGLVDGNDDPLLWNAIRSALAPVNTNTNKPILLLPSEKRANVASLREFVTTLRPGERNNGLYWAICRCIESGIDPHELIEPALLIGLSEDEVSLSVDAALRRAGLGSAELMSEAEALFPETD